MVILRGHLSALENCFAEQLSKASIILTELHLTFHSAVCKQKIGMSWDLAQGWAGVKLYTSSLPHLDSWIVFLPSTRL
jgi:hypothetical protein